jgi:hypothetical protein
MSMKDRLAKLEAKRVTATSDLPPALARDMQFIFDNYGREKMLQIALNDEAGNLNDDDNTLIAEANEMTPALQKEGGMMWLCRLGLRMDREI